MVRPKQIAVLAGFVASILALSSCANGPLADTLQRSLEADPRLTDNPAVFGNPSPSPSGNQTDTVSLPANFPTDIPRYPGATLMAVRPDGTVASTTPSVAQPVETRWRTTDSAAQIQQFYQTILPPNDWQIEPSNPEATDNWTLVVERDGLQLRVAILDPAQANSLQGQPAPSPTAGTDFTLTYSRVDGSIAQPSPGSPSSAIATQPQPGDPTFIGPVAPSTPGPSPTNPPNSTPNDPSAAQTFIDLNQAPEELRPYLTDLTTLGVFASPAGSPSSREFKPNAVVTRRDYARWLITANNLMYANRPAQKIRLGVSTDQPIFQDVPRTDPDFAAIQGLAEAGLIPSPLSGDAATVTFRPDAPLTRESLLLWKAPMDSRQTLPNATVQSVQQTWGFQDAARIDPRALRAVLADYQNGDLSNVRRAFGYTTLFQPKQTVTRAEAAATLWYFGLQGDGISAHDVLQSRGN